MCPERTAVELIGPTARDHRHRGGSVTWPNSWKPVSARQNRPRTAQMELMLLFFTSNLLLKILVRELALFTSEWMQARQSETFV